MHKFTVFPFWTEAHQVVHTDHSSSVSVSAVRAVFAESSVVPGTVFNFGLRVDVQKWTLFVATLTKLGVEVALRHLGHAILVEKFTLVSLLTQSSEPVLAHNSLLSADVTERTHPTFHTCCSHEKFTDSSARLVHSRERQRLCAQLLFHSDLQVELDVIHSGEQLLHVCSFTGPQAREETHLLEANSEPKLMLAAGSAS